MQTSMSIRGSQTSMSMRGSQTSMSMRGSLNEQLARLQGKHNAELELIEDMRQFSRQRSIMEKQYSDNMHRLVTHFNSKREILKPVEVPGFNRQENRGLMEVWKALLDKTEDLSKRRLTISELLITQVSDVMKQQKRVKEANYKRLIDVCQKMNSEILESTKKLAVTKKSYGEVEKVCEEARSKYNEAENRLKKKDLKFFESLAHLEKNHKKMSDRLKSCQRRTICSRNDYLLTLATTNAHLDRHRNKDLPRLMQALDGDLYEVIQRAYISYAQLEADAALFVKAEFADLAEQANFVSRDYVVEVFLQKHSCLQTEHKYTFEPYGQDTVTAISRDHGAEIFLDKDARRWTNTLTKDQAVIASLQKQVKGLESVTSAYAKNPEFGTSESYTEAVQAIDQFQEEIRQVEVQVTMAEARLETLKQAGIDVNKWLRKAESIHKEKSSTIATTNETSSLRTSHIRMARLSLPYPMGDSQEFDVETSSDISGRPDLDDTTSMSSFRSESQPKICRIIYNYTAQHPDELSIVEGEEMEVLEWDDGDGWCKAKKTGGQEGYLPQSYVHLISRPSSPSASITRPSSPSAPITITSAPLASISNQMSSVSTSSLLTATGPSASPSHSLANGTGGDVMLKAIYDYTAQFEGELSFEEGAVIKLLRTDENGVDDGWWEGSYQGTVGVFPSVVVETMTNGITMSIDMNSTLHVNPLLQSQSPPRSSPSPPMESPPPLPSDYIFFNTSSHLHNQGKGNVTSTKGGHSSQVTPVNRPSNAAPSLQMDGALSRDLRDDSFDEYD